MRENLLTESLKIMKKQENNELIVPCLNLRMRNRMSSSNEDYVKTAKFAATAIIEAIDASIELIAVSYTHLTLPTKA